MRQILFFLALSVLAAALPATAGEGLSRETWRALQASEALTAAGKQEEAVVRLGELLTRVADKPHDRAVVLQARGHVLAAREEYRAAMADFQASLELGVLPLPAAQGLRYNLAQLGMMTREYRRVIAVLSEWIRHQEKPKAEVQALLGGAHLSLGQHRQAARALEEALALTREPRENWMQSLLSAYFELKAYDRGQTLLEKMVRLFPDKGGYWRQLGGILLLRNKEKEALAVLELAHLAGYVVEERDLLNLAQLHLQRHAPFKAALLLTDELTRGRLPENGRNLELAAHAWRLARERGRAVALLEKAWNQEERLALGVGLAQLYAEERQWERVVGLLAGPLTHRQPGEEAGRAWILLGMARFETGKREEARDAFQQAAAFRASRKEAEQWLTFLGREGSDADASS